MLKELLTTTRVRNLAGPKIAKVAEKLGKSGAVGSLVLPDEERATATVAAGGENFAIELIAEGERLRWHCPCALGKTGAICEHVAAVALVVCGAVEPVATKKKKPATTSAIGQLRQSLLAMSVEEVTAIVMEQAEVDMKLKERLLLAVRLRQQSSSFDE